MDRPLRVMATVTQPDIPVPTRWIAELPGTVKVPPLALGADLCVRADDTLLWLDPETGAARARVALATSASHSFLLAIGDLVLVDHRHGRTQSTWLDVVRGGAVERTVDLGCIVGTEGAAVSGAELFVVGGDGPVGPVLRSVDPVTGVRRVDQRIVPDGRDVFAVSDRLLVLNSTGEPGLISVDRDGGTAWTIEQTRSRARGSRPDACWWARGAVTTRSARRPCATSRRATFCGAFRRTAH